MRLWRSPRADTPARGHDAMRLRVSQAVEAARMAQADVPAGLGSARIDAVIARRLDTAAQAAVTGQVERSRRRAERGLAPELLWATARAAREVGRRPEEVWAEALHDWLAVHGQPPATSAPPRAAEPRRQRCWREIEQTLQVLRAP